MTSDTRAPASVEPAQAAGGRLTVTVWTAVLVTSALPAIDRISISTE